MGAEDWQRGNRQALAILFEAPAPEPSWLLLLNAGEADVEFTLPPGRWTLRLASDPDADEADAAPLEPTRTLPPGSLRVART